MAKRFQPMKEFGRSMKKPKLDISINRADTTQRHSNSTANTNRNGGAMPTINFSQNNFWDDEDDDVILLATQVAEASYTIKKDGCNNTIAESSEITFSEFMGAASTSTQKPVPAPTYNIESDILSQMFEDDDDLLAAVEKKDPVFKKPLSPPTIVSSTFQATASKTRTNESKMAQKIATQKVESEDTDFRLTQNAVPDTGVMSSQSAARRTLASERQIKFLMEKVDALKKENSKISNDLMETKTKMQSKDGEVSLLRDELKHIKQQAQSLRMEKIFSTEAAKGECQSKIAELAKKVEAQQTEIRLKEAQASRMKMKQADETQKLQQTLSMIQVNGADRDVLAVVKRDRKYNKCIMHMQCLDLNNSRLATEKEPDFHAAVFQHSLDQGGSIKRKTLFESELENIQTLLAQLQLIAVHEIPETFINQCVESAAKTLPEFWSYTHTLYYLKYCEIHPYHNYALSDAKICTPRLLQQPSEIYEHERCLCFRRYVAILAIMCRREPSIALALLQHKHGEYYLLQIATDAITTLGFACGICEHFGVLEAFTVLLKSLLQHITSETETIYLGMLVDMMKHIVFTRPCAWIFCEISISMRECCKVPEILDMLCVNSSEDTFVADRVKSTYRFSNDSCFIQVYCGLLEIAFPLSSRLALEHFKLLVDICLNHVRFTYHCFTQPPKFIHKMLPIYDDDEDEDEHAGQAEHDNSSRSNMAFETTDATSTSTRTASMINSTNSTNAATNRKDNSAVDQRCECYIKLCLSVVTLVFQLMRQWFCHKMEYYTEEVAEISRLSVQLLHMIFCEYYLTCLFRESEATTKYYLSLILKWWSDNAKKLNFNEIDLKYLQKIQSSHVIPKDIAAETNLSNVMLDLSSWQKESTNDDVSRIKLSNEEEAQKITDKLELIEIASKEELFFDAFKGYAFNFQ